MISKVIWFVAAMCICVSVQGSVLSPGKLMPGSETRRMSLEEQIDVYMDHSERIQWIFPGTKWCGDGDIAFNYTDLGFFEDTDKCCRGHDYCDDVIDAGSSEHGLTNNGSFTRLNCKCDSDFYDCLKAVEGSTISTTVGVSYFNALGAQCFEYNHTATCLEYDSIIGQRKRCVHYEYDETTPMSWQWLDVPRYLTLFLK